MTQNNLEIREATLEEIFKIHKNIPEFQGNPPHTIEEFQNELNNNKDLKLICYINGNPAGYSIGYDKFKDGSFYSWLGGVMPEFRRHGVYKTLRDYQEKWAKTQGFKSIKVKTWNRRTEMRIALASMGYNIIELEEKPDVLDNRLMHEKLL